jgi:hypothetical protein
MSIDWLWMMETGMNLVASFLLIPFIMETLKQVDEENQPVTYSFGAFIIMAIWL